MNDTSRENCMEKFDDSYEFARNLSENTTYESLSPTNNLDDVNLNAKSQQRRAMTCELSNNNNNNNTNNGNGQNRTVLLPIKKTLQFSLNDERRRKMTGKSYQDEKTPSNQTGKKRSTLYFVYEMIFKKFICLLLIVLVVYCIVQNNLVKNEMENLKLKTNKLMYVIDKISENDLLLTLNNKVICFVCYYFNSIENFRLNLVLEETFCGKCG